MGTYLGEPSEADDQLYEESIAHALSLGCNLIDTAINYRHMRSERNIARALSNLVASSAVQRDEVVICTKGGYLPYDVDSGLSPQAYWEREFIGPGLVSEDDATDLAHSLEPRFIKRQLEMSLANLGMDAVDIFYLHNPETQLGKLDRAEFYTRVSAVFRMLEEEVKKGTIGCYGVATWHGFREPDNSKTYLSLAELYNAATAAGGEKHNFAAIQLPLNLSHPQALAFANQPLPGKKEALPVLVAASRMKVGVFTSASLDQGKLSKFLPKEVDSQFPGLPDDAHRALQFARSCPGVVASLVGMKHPQHVATNLQLLNYLPTPSENFIKLFGME